MRVRRDVIMKHPEYFCFGHRAATCMCGLSVAQVTLGVVVVVGVVKVVWDDDGGVDCGGKASHRVYNCKTQVLRKVMYTCQPNEEHDPARSSEVTHILCQLKPQVPN